MYPWPHTLLLGFGAGVAVDLGAQRNLDNLRCFPAHYIISSFTNPWSRNLLGFTDPPYSAAILRLRSL